MGVPSMIRLYGSSSGHSQIRERPRTKLACRLRLRLTKLLSAYQLAFFTPGISPL